MSKEVILMESVEGLGTEGDVVQVANGYARNYLLPKQLAAPVTKATRRRLASRQKERREKADTVLLQAEALAEKIKKASCTMLAKAGEDGKMFGSISAADIIDVLKTMDIEVTKKQLTMDKPLRELGVFKVDVTIHPEVTAVLKVWIVEE